ncbi:protein tem1 [Anaeramoeba ignava]|uniref:Protein tem1 n=1 Tax=Anaeramoeba ignava TaxID=1746090 RepID=A0A9Q0LZH6_ANAIG|nr:protein tem1 [Anaeramoeba ignava]|eukprot:Anaeramoba_ignava/a8442_66.p1 GENE.a8442_66~~a8442_66.p1  ORF type:complete len:195 (+),score=64.09 a8442_66:34-618(+)
MVDNQPSMTLKVGLLGDSYTGKTSLMVKYVENIFEKDYLATLGVNFMEKIVKVSEKEITFSIWDLGGEEQFQNMMPIVCIDAVALLYLFDLTRIDTLSNVKSWIQKAHKLNPTAIPLLIGTKYDLYAVKSEAEQKEMTDTARKFAKAMDCPLIYCSSSHSINIQKIFKVILSKVFSLEIAIPKISGDGDPILEY